MGTSRRLGGDGEGGGSNESEDRAVMDKRVSSWYGRRRKQLNVPHGEVGGSSGRGSRTVEGVE